jgi:PAS domain S-box-containing protein
MSEDLSPPDESIEVDARGDRGPDRAASAGSIDGSVRRRAMDEAPVGITIADATDSEMPLVYVNAAFERLTGYPPSFAIGRNCRFLQGDGTRAEPVARMRAAIEEGTATSVELRNYRRSGELFWNQVTIAPLRDEAGEIAYYVGFQQDVTRRKHAERAATRHASRVETERAAQRYLLERLDGVIADVTEAVLGARDPSELSCTVIESLESTYAGSWMGAYDPATAAVTPVVLAGVTPGDVAARTFSRDDAGDPVATAVSTALRDGCVQIEPLAADVGDVTAVAAVPRQYGDVSYGTVCVYPRAPDGFADHERDVLGALGRVIATGLHALESQRARQSEEIVELTVALSAGHPLIELASRLDCRVEYAGSVGDRDRPADLFELDVQSAAVRSATEDLAIDLHAVVVDGDGDCLVELSAREPRFRSLLGDHSAELTAATFEPNDGAFTVEVGRESLGRSLADALLDRFDSWDVVGYRRRGRRTETPREFVAELEAELTDRQHAALVRAYTGGYFEWPHEASGADVAAAMGVCRSTFHQHLRAALRKLVGAVVDRSERGTPGADTGPN